MTPVRRRVARRTTWAALALATGLSLAGCATEAAPSGPSGVDGLEVPTPTPDARDYVDGLDNTWLALESDQAQLFDNGDLTRTVTLTDETVPVAGVDTSVVHVEETDADGKSTDVHDDLLAQDRAGNVWLFGRRVIRGDLRSWQAGQDGAEAGLLLPARPRRGDGFAVADARGADEDRAQVTAYDGRLLSIEVTSELEPGRSVTRTYERGVGLSTEETISGTWQRSASTG